MAGGRLFRGREFVNELFKVLTLGRDTDDEFGVGLVALGDAVERVQEHPRHIHPGLGLKVRVELQVGRRVLVLGVDMGVRIDDRAGGIEFDVLDFERAIIFLVQGVDIGTDEGADADTVIVDRGLAEDRPRMHSLGGFEQLVFGGLPHINVIGEKAPSTHGGVEILAAVGDVETNALVAAGFELQLNVGIDRSHDPRAFDDDLIIVLQRVAVVDVKVIIVILFPLPGDDLLNRVTEKRVLGVIDLPLDRAAWLTVDLALDAGAGRSGHELLVNEVGRNLRVEDDPELRLLSPERRFQDLPLGFGEAMRLFDPADIDAFRRLDFVDVAPEAVEDELGPGLLVPDGVLQDLELGTEPEAFDLGLQERVNTL